MEALDRIKRRLFLRRRAREADTKVPAGRRATVNLETARNVVLLFPADRVEDRKTVDRWRDRHAGPRKHVRAAGVFTEKVGHANFDFLAFDPTHLNWYGAPKGEVYDRFKTLDCDLLLRLGAADDPLLDYLAAVLPAALKVGPFRPDADFVYDLQYDPTGNPKLSQQLALIASIFTYTNAATT